MRKCEHCGEELMEFVFCDEPYGADWECSNDCEYLQYLQYLEEGGK